MSGTNANPCFGCRAGFHNECESVWLEVIEQECCCGGDITFDTAGNVRIDAVDESVFTGTEKEIDNGYINDGYQGNKSLSEYSDPVSTGRKRAKEMYPITPGMVCEWAGLKFAGGGVVPIVGCVGRPASDRHHGPDKNTMNNAPGNLHRICDHCHNTWHALNDPHYGERPEHTKPFLPLSGECAKHDAVTRATTAEVIEAETKRLQA
jgi:hypothetical protein